jgi:hypothetical protein
MIVYNARPIEEKELCDKVWLGMLIGCKVNDIENKTIKGTRTSILNTIDVLPTGTAPLIFNAADAQIIARQTGTLNVCIAGKKKAAYSTNKTG